MAAPILTEQFDEALLFASRVHREQTRKGTRVPYISHLLGVCAVVLEYGGNEVQAIAALLHDAPEDQGGAEMLETIRRSFGERVATLVEQCGEPLVAKSMPWKDRKEAFLNAIDRLDPEACLVIAADKIHNLTAILGDRRHLGDSVFSRFNGGKDGTQWYYEELAKRLEPLLPLPCSTRLSDLATQLAGA